MAHPISRGSAGGTGDAVTYDTSRSLQRSVGSAHKFGAWWLQQMTDLTPPAIRFWNRPSAHLVISDLADANGDLGFSVGVSSAGQETEYGRFPLVPESGPAVRSLVAQRRLPGVVTIRTNRARVLDRPVVLPQTVEPDLDRVMGYEIDRLTPFRPDEVFWTWVVTQRSAEGDRLTVRLSFLPKSTVSGLMRIAEQSGLTPEAVESQSLDGELRSIPLASAKDAGAKSHIRATQAALWTCGMLALSVLTVPLLQQSIAGYHIETQIESMKPSVAKAEALRRAATNPAAGAELIAASQAEAGNVLEILAAVTSALPDDSFLTSFSLSHRMLSMEGSSATAVRLITLLSANRIVSNPRFAAPVTRSQSGSDIFSIQAEARQ